MRKQNRIEIRKQQNAALKKTWEKVGIEIEVITAEKEMKTGQKEMKKAKKK